MSLVRAECEFMREKALRLYYTVINNFGLFLIRRTGDRASTSKVVASHYIRGRGLINLRNKKISFSGHVRPGPGCLFILTYSLFNKYQRKRFYIVFYTTPGCNDVSRDALTILNSFDTL